MQRIPETLATRDHLALHLLHPLHGHGVVPHKGQHHRLSQRAMAVAVLNQHQRRDASQERLEGTAILGS